MQAALVSRGGNFIFALAIAKNPSEMIARQGIRNTPKSVFIRSVWPSRTRCNSSISRICPGNWSLFLRK